MSTGKIPFAAIGVSISLGCAVISGGVFVHHNLAAQSSEESRQTALRTAAKDALAKRYLKLNDQPFLTVGSPVRLPDGLVGGLPFSLVYLEEAEQWANVARKGDEFVTTRVFTSREIKAAQSNLISKKED